MLVFKTKAAAGRGVLRRHHPLSNGHTNITRRYNSTNNPGPPKHVDVTSNTTIPTQNAVPLVPLWQRFGMLSRGIAAYGRSQQKRPYRTQFITSLVIYVLGDLSAQNISGDDYDPARTMRALVISAFSSIPSYKWFMYLNDHFNFRSKILSLATKVVVNQIAFAPIINTYFFGMQSLLSGDSLPEVWERIKRTVPISLINSMKFWPVVTAFSFTFIDPQYRSVFAGGIAVGWQTYLSYLNRTAERAAEEERVKDLDQPTKKEEIHMVQVKTQSTQA